MKIYAIATSKWRVFRKRVPLATLLILLVIAITARAQVTNIIYQDGFKRIGPLDGSAPDRAVGNSFWKAVPELLTDGTNLCVAVTQPPPSGGVNQFNNAFLPFKPRAGHIYMLSVEIKGVHGDANWLAFGYAQMAQWDNYFAADDIGVGWLLQRANNAGIQVFQGPGTSGDDTFSSGRNTNAFNKYDIVLDTTTGDADGGWTATFFQNGNEIKECVYSENPSITCVGVGADGATGYYRNFSLTECTPLTPPRGLTNRPANEYRNVAYWKEPGVQVQVSSHSFLNGGMKDDDSVCPLNRPLIRTQPGSRYWISSDYEHLPQWIWFHFSGPRKIDKVVLDAADLETSPVEFSGQYLAGDDDTFQPLFHAENAQFDPRTRAYTNHFSPVIARDFRLVIQRNKASVTPRSWIAELARVQIFGIDATNGGPPVTVSAAKTPTHLDSGLSPTKFVPKVRDLGQVLDISTPWYRLVLDKAHPRILRLSWDSLGKGELSVNFLEESGAGPVLDPVFQKPIPPGASALTRLGNVFRYEPVDVATGACEQLSIRINEHGFDLGLAAAAEHTMTVRGGLFRFHFAAGQTPTTFVGRPSEIMNYVAMPTYLAAPDFGTAYITRTGDDAAFYRKPSALFPATTYWVDVTPNQPTGEDGLNEIGPQPWHTTIHFEVQRLEPLPDLAGTDSRLQRFPKYSLNMVQWRPDIGLIANSVMSIDCGLSTLFYAEQALFAPRLENGISPMALVGASVDRYLQGAPGYQMPNLNACAPNWSSSRETAAYLIISGWYVIRTIGGKEQLDQWIDPLECLAKHLEAQFGMDGLIHHHDGGSMWFDTYQMQGADAYCNAADYRAFQCMADLETVAGRPDLAMHYQADASRLAAAYFKSFYNPETGVLAGWRSDDGKLHDYMFPWVNGFAICQGLVPAPKARNILQVLLAKLEAIGFHSYPLGLPTNLTPMSPADYIPDTSGAPRRADGTDTWQIYMNGGATPALEYYLIQALYQTGQYEAGERLLWPLMESYEKGTFNAGIQLPRQRQRNPVGSAFYQWDGSHGAGEGYLPEDWDGVEAFFTGHYGIGFDKNGYYLEPWSPLKGQRIKLDLPYMGTNVPYVTSSRQTIK